jgi:hypothetical protein
MYRLTVKNDARAAYMPASKDEHQVASEGRQFRFGAKFVGQALGDLGRRQAPLMRDTLPACEQVWTPVGSKAAGYSPGYTHHSTRAIRSTRHVREVLAKQLA